ncbi:hypothetical protein SAY87_029633 [Trapa incisa]|uniref:Uncharacterized protein n=1 Tax=Trapa incisa TaxID=236973 RepID=A0AAN7Q9H8_9MYRT|nr:hypothetical protein SAY87_029633 [Trapa incisa]
MRDHLDDCMTLASCSSACTPKDGGGDGDQLVRTRRRCDLHGDDLAEPSPTRRQSSRILNWAARQTQETITTIDRKNRDSELMALAGLHPVSKLDSSFLRESQSPTPGRQGNVERPSTRASAILQMWRELEDEQLLNQAGVRVRESFRHQRSTESNILVSGTNREENRENENGESIGAVTVSENEYGTRSRAQTESQNNHGNSNGSRREQSPDFDDVDRERVRHIVGGWMEGAINSHSTSVTQRSNNPRAELLGETERARVRVVREWMQMTSQRERGSHCQRGGQSAAVQADHAREGTLTEHDERQPEYIHGDRLRFPAMQGVDDLVVRSVRERQRELQTLWELRAVSGFVHHNRIQSLLRARFMQNEGSVEDEQPPSVAANELLQLRQRNTVSGLRGGFHSGLATILRGHATSQHETSMNGNISDSRSDRVPVSFQDIQLENREILQPTAEESDASHLHQTPITGSNIERTSLHEANHHEAVREGVNSGEERTETHGHLTEERIDNTEDQVQNWPENPITDGQRAVNSTEEDGRHLHQNHQVWNEDDPPEAAGNWSEGPSGLPHAHRPPLRRYNRFHPHGNDSVYSMELRDLLSRRSVSNLLQSDFRESLDQLIQSYVERQERAPIDWDPYRNSLSPSPASPVRDQEMLRNEQMDDAIGRPSVVPPAPPPQPFEHQGLHHNGWSRHAMYHRSDIEFEMIEDLKADVSRIQESMTQMQRMLEACMDMQLELQRSVKQEVSAALNRYPDKNGACLSTFASDLCISYPTSFNHIMCYN